MAYNFKRLFKKPKVFLGLTGISFEEFEKILKMAEPICKENVQKTKLFQSVPMGWDL